MKKLKIAAALVSAIVLVSCGGGGDVAGDVGEMSLTPDAVKFGPTSDCSAFTGESFWVTISGGQAPFRIHNTFPSYMQIDRTEATGKDPRFKVTMLQGCGEDISIAVYDYHSKQANVEVTVEYEKPQ